MVKTRNFITWDVLNAIYIMPSMLFKTNRNNLDSVATGRHLPPLQELLSIIIIFNLTVFALIFFRSVNLHEALHFISIIFFQSLFNTPKLTLKLIFLLLFIFVVVEWMGREQNYVIEKMGIFMLLFSGAKQAVIYFQFW